MQEQAQKIQAVINTMQELMIPATAENMGKLLSCLQILVQVKEKLEENTAE